VKRHPSFWETVGGDHGIYPVIYEPRNTSLFIT
jgi:hypothetical protein